MKIEYIEKYLDSPFDELDYDRGDIECYVIFYKECEDLELYKEYKLNKWSLEMGEYFTLYVNDRCINLFVDSSDNDQWPDIQLISYNRYKHREYLLNKLLS